MAKFKITLATGNDETEEVEADDFVDEGEWTTFRIHAEGYAGPGKTKQVMRIRQKNYDRIDRIAD